MMALKNREFLRVCLHTDKLFTLSPAFATILAEFALFFMQIHVVDVSNGDFSVRFIRLVSARWCNEFANIYIYIYIYNS